MWQQLRDVTDTSGIVAPERLTNERRTVAQLQRRVGRLEKQLEQQAAESKARIQQLEQQLADSQAHAQQLVEQQVEQGQD